MNYSSLALAFAFAGIAMPFLTKAKKEVDPVQKRNKRTAGFMFLAAGAAFFVSFAISAVNR